jgi:hypothetical protein
MRVLFLLIGVVVSVTEPAAAQAIPAGSFEDLQKLLRPGQQVTVRDQAGGKQAGRFVSMTSHDMILDVPRRSLWVGQVERRSFAEDAVSRVDIDDSLLNGILIGGGIGAAVAYAATRCDNDCDDVTNAYMALFEWPLYTLGGASIGGLVDRLVHQTVFASPRTRHVRFEPLVGFSRAGIAARISF